MGSLMQDLNRRSICTKRQVYSNGQSRGGIRFGVGALAHLLRNRFYIGEVVYRGKVHRGEHEPIVGRALFEAVQTKLAASATDRQLRLKGSPAILAGRIFDDRGNRMTPTHTNKRGVRYRYYVSHAFCKNETTRLAACLVSRRQRSKALCSRHFASISAPTQGASGPPRRRTEIGS